MEKSGVGKRGDARGRSLGGHAGAAQCTAYRAVVAPQQ